MQEVLFRTVRLRGIRKRSGFSAKIRYMGEIHEGIGTGQLHAIGGAEVTNGSYNGRLIVPNTATAGTVYYPAITPARVPTLKSLH